MKKEELIEFLETVGTASIDDIANALAIPKFGENSAYNLVKELKNEGLVIREGHQWRLVGAEPSPVQTTPQTMQEFMQAMAKMIEEATKPKKLDDWEMASGPMRTEIEEEEKSDLERYIITPDSIEEAKKELIGFKTYTFLDDLFLKADGTSLEGVPIHGQFLLSGLPGSGKSILMEEIAVKVAAAGNKVLFITSEDTWKSGGSRFDLQSRCKEKADILELDWDKIRENLFIIDTVSNSELRDWSAFAEIYRFTIESRKIDLVIVDSVTALETYRGALKYRLLELARYNQLHNVTGIFVNQRSADKWDSYEIAGGIGIAHNLDSTMILDFGRLYYGDQIQQVGGKRGDFVRIFRIMDCRLCNYVRERLPIEITSDGFVKLLI